MQARRSEYGQQAQTLDLSKVLFLDEFGCTTSLTRSRGRAEPGVRVAGAVPGGHWKVTSVVGAMRLEGMTAVGAMESAIDGDAFVAYVQHVLVPVLRPEDVVVLDNLGAHQVAAVKRAIESAGARLLFLPPYSPDLNPIEKCWSKVKQYLRSAAARTQEALGQAIQNAFATVTTEDIRNWFASCGYAVH